MKQPNGYSFIFWFTVISTLSCALLLFIRFDYTDELLIFIIIPVIYAAQAYPRRVYLPCQIIGIIISLIVMLIHFQRFIYGSALTVIFLSVAVIVICEIINQATNALRYTKRESERVIHELQTALAQVKSLKGMLPICSCCKKIRDDQGYWNQIEEYVSQHSDAEFTHGLCPDCIQKHYPDFSEDIQERTASV